MHPLRRLASEFFSELATFWSSSFFLYFSFYFSFLLYLEIEHNPVAQSLIMNRHNRIIHFGIVLIIRKSESKIISSKLSHTIVSYVTTLHYIVREDWKCRGNRLLPIKLTGTQIIVILLPTVLKRSSTWNGPIKISKKFDSIYLSVSKDTGFDST